MKKFLIYIMALFILGTTSFAYASPPPPGHKISHQGTPPPSEKHHDHGHDDRVPPPPPPRVVVDTQVFETESGFANCIDHYLITKTVYTYYSDGTSDEVVTYHVVDSYGNYIAQNCRSVEHYILNENHYMILRYGTTNYKLVKILPNNTQYQSSYKRLELIGENRFLAKVDKYEGIIDLDENEIVPIEYKEIKHLYNDLYRTKLNGYYGIVRVDGTMVLPCENDKISSMGNFYKVKKDKLYGVVDKRGNIVAPLIYRKVKLERNQVKVSRDGNTWLSVFTTLR